MLRLRVISALLLAPPVLAAIWVGSWWLAALLALTAVLMAREWAILCQGRMGPGGAALAAFGAGVALVTAADSRLGLLPLPFGAAAAAILAVPGRRLWLAGGMLYIGVPVWALTWLSGEGREVLLWAVLLVWATDIGAYAAGRSIGGPRLAPGISPGKTWAGLAGGMIAAALTGWGVAEVAGSRAPLAVAALSLAMAVVAQLGDLAESAVKRHYGVKDSGSLIPGHGGLFDRLDGLLATAPVVALLCLAFGDPVRAWR